MAMTKRILSSSPAGTVARGGSPSRPRPVDSHKSDHRRANNGIPFACSTILRICPSDVCFSRSRRTRPVIAWSLRRVRGRSTNCGRARRAPTSGHSRDIADDGFRAVSTMSTGGWSWAMRRMRRHEAESMRSQSSRAMISGSRPRCCRVMSLLSLEAASCRRATGVMPFKRPAAGRSPGTTASRNGCSIGSILSFRRTRTTGTHASKGAWHGVDPTPPDKKSMPRNRAAALRYWTRAVLPMPGSPLIHTTAPLPSASASISRSR